MRQSVVRPLLLATTLSACITPVGQKVTVLLTNETVSCDGPAFEGPATEGPDYTTPYPASATLILEQVDDLYMLQFEATNADRGFTRPSIRNGLEVTLPCVQGETQLVVRRASILQARSEAAGGSGDDGGDGGSGGGSNPPPGGGG